MVLHGYYCDVDGGCDNINAQKSWLTSKRVSFLSSFCPRPSTRFVCEPTFSQKNISIYVMFIDRYDVPYTDCVGIVLLMLCFFDHGIDTCIQSKRSQRALWPQQKPPMWWSQQKPAVPSGRLPGMTKPAAESLKCWPQKISTRCFQEVSRLLRVHHGAMARRVSLQIFARFSQVPPTCLHYCKEKRHLFSPVFSFIWRRMSADRHRPKALCPYRTLVGVLLLCILAARFKGGCSGGM